MTRSEKNQIYLLILIAVLICSLIVAIIVLVKNADEIRESPVEYAIKHTQLESCSCYTSEGFNVNFPLIKEEEMIHNWTS